MQLGKVSKTLIKLNGWLTILLVAFCIFGVHDTRSRLDGLSKRVQRSAVLQIVSTVINNGDVESYTESQKQAMVEQLVVIIGKELRPLLVNVTSVFFLGNSDGTLPAFASTLFSYTFKEFGANVALNGDIITKAVRDYRKVCDVRVQCKITGTVQCPNGNSAWCPEPGVSVSCNSCSWTGSFIDAAAITTSVATKLASNWNDIPDTATSTPAFSAGIFRLDEVFPWVQHQVDAQKWKVAGTNCLNFVDAVERVPWVGTYTDSNGNVDSWDARSQVKSVSDTVRQVCTALSRF